MIKQNVSVSAVVRDPLRMAQVARDQFCNAICKSCVNWGPPNAPCRDRLVAKRQPGSYSAVTVTCLEFAKSLQERLGNTVKDLELAQKQLTTIRANIQNLLNPPKQEITGNTKDKMKALLKTLDEGEKEKESKKKADEMTLAALRVKESDTEAFIAKLNAEIRTMR